MSKKSGQYIMDEFIRNTKGNAESNSGLTIRSIYTESNSGLTIRSIYTESNSGLTIRSIYMHKFWEAYTVYINTGNISEEPAQKIAGQFLRKSKSNTENKSCFTFTDKYKIQF